MIASIEHDIAVLNLSDRGLTDDRLGALFAKAPLNSIILLEDIDAAFGSREAAIKASELIKVNNGTMLCVLLNCLCLLEDPAAYQGFSPLTLSGLLNALDGVAESDGRIVFMTTNYIDRLNLIFV